MFNKKALAFGEVHGITNLTEAKLAIISEWLTQGRSVSVCLERDFTQQIQIEEWLQKGRPGSLLSLFEKPTSSQFLEDQYSFLDQLSYSHRKHPGKMRVHCVDLSFGDPEDANSKKILAIQDEDLFDSEREHFIVSQMQSHKNELDKSDKIIWIAGNMHASKTAMYFPRIGKPTRHISTAAMWLNETYGLESIFALPFAGKINYQAKGRLSEEILKNPTAITDGWIDSPFQGYRASQSISNAPQNFKDSFDWIYGINPANASKPVSR